MPKLKSNAPKKLKKKRMSEELSKFKNESLHSGSKTGPIVKDRSQALAISLNEAGLSSKKKKMKKKKK